MSDDAEAIAKKVGAHIEARDEFAKSLGISLEEIRPGYVRLAMTVRPGMVNQAGIGHGGAVYSLADTAFGYACNSHDELSLATHGAISYLASVQVGDRLVAEAREITRQGRTGVADITVTNQDGQVVALLRSQSRRVRGPVVPTADDG